jgi:hypothetical protein
MLVNKLLLVAASSALIANVTYKIVGSSPIICA